MARDTSKVRGGVSLEDLNAGTNLATFPVTERALRVAATIALTMVCGAFVAIVFGQQPAPRVPAFLPTIVGAVIVTELLSAYLFFAHFRLAALPRLLFLATAYLAAGTLAIPYLLTFPGVFSPSGLFGANEQTAFYLWMCWHSAFPGLILFSTVVSGESRRRLSALDRPAFEGSWLAIAAAVATCAFASVVIPAVLIAFRERLPILLTNGVFSEGTHLVAVPLICTVGAAAVVRLLLTPRPYPTTTVWLAVAVTASALDTAMGVLSARYSYCWYAGKAFMLVASSVILAVYTLEVVKLQARLANATDELRHVNEMERGKAEQRLARRDALIRALQRREFVVHYQPLLDLRTGFVESVEALIRWDDPESGLIAPDVFIATAEETGVMESIGRWVLETAIRQARSWNGSSAPLKISVNVSARQLQDERFARHLRDVLERNGVAPEQIQLEVTESVAMADPVQAGEILWDCRRLGVSIALDDFGTHYSSLKYLQSLPIDTIKIDRSFIKELPFNAHDAAIVRAVISLGHDLGRTIVAEGVETDRQLAWLRAAGCDAVQGYLIGQPMIAEALTTRLATLQCYARTG